MEPINQIPAEAFQWLFVAFVFLVIGIRSTLNYRKSKNPVSLSVAVSTLGASISYIIWGLPAVFTNDENTIRYAGMVGDVNMAFVVGSLVVLLWLLLLKNKRISKWLVYIPAFAVSLVSAIETIKEGIDFENYAHINDSGELLLGNLPSVLSLLFVFVFLPLAYVFVRSAIGAETGVERIRSSALSVVFLGLALVEIQANSLSAASSSQETERYLIFGVVGFFAILFLLFAQLAKHK